MFPVLKTSDLVQFIPNGNHIVPPIVAPVPLVGKSMQLFYGMPICVAGDEIPSFLRVPLPYTAPPFTTPGMGKLVVVPPPTHYSKTYLESYRPALLMGPPFPAQFIVNAPATQQAGPVPVPDPVLTKPFTVQYISTTPTYLIM
jgi:hypothetical protein